jgi:hypothetical protein
MRINGTLVTSLLALFEFILSVKFHISYNDLVYIVFLRFQRKSLIPRRQSILKENHPNNSKLSIKYFFEILIIIGLILIILLFLKK